MLDRASPQLHLPLKLAQPHNHCQLVKTLNDDHDNFNQLANRVINYT